jgi:hypothetical protein
VELRRVAGRAGGKRQRETVRRPAVVDLGLE